MAATAQDASAPLKGPDKKDEDRDEESKLRYRMRLVQQHSHRLFPLKHSYNRLQLVRKFQQHCHT